MKQSATVFPNGVLCILEGQDVATHIPGLPAAHGGMVDLAQAWLADRLGLPYPPSIAARAGHLENEPDLAAAEAKAAQALHDYVTLAGLDLIR